MDPLRELYYKFTDEYGFVTGDGKPCQNGILFTAYYIVALFNHNKAVDGEKNRLRLLYQTCEPYPGIISRKPFDTEQEGPDDYFGALLVDRELSTGFAKRFLERGRRNWYFYNNENPTKKTLKSFLGRFPTLIAHAQVCSGESLGVLATAAWCLGLLASALSTRLNQDANAFGWVMVKAARDRSNLAMRLVTRFWKWRFRRKFPEGMGELLGAYYDNEEHPSSIYLTGDCG